MAKADLHQKVVLSKEEIDAYISAFPNHESRIKAYINAHIAEIKSGIKEGYLKKEILNYSIK